LHGLGIPLLHAQLNERGIAVSNERLLDSLRRADADGIALRKKACVRRTVYQSSGSNHLYHIDQTAAMDGTLTLPSGQPLLQRSNCFHIAALHRVILPVLQQQLQVLLNRGTGVQSEAVLRLFALHRTTAPTLLHSRSPPLCQAQKFCGCNTMRLEEPLHCQQSSVLKKHVSLRQCARESMTQSKPCLVHHKPISVHDMFMIW